MLKTNQQSEITNLASGAGLGVLGAILGRGLSLLGNVFAARILGPTMYGAYSIGWMLLRFISLLAPLGLEKGVIRFSSKYIDSDKGTHKGLIILCICVPLVIGLFLGFSLYLFAPLLAEKVYNKPYLVPVFQYFAFAFPPIVLLTVVSAAIRSTRQLEYSVAIQDLGQPMLGLVLMIFFYFNGLRLFGIILSDVLSLSISVIAGVIVLYKIFPHVFTRSIKLKYPGRELFLFSIPASFAGAIVVYIFWVDRLLVGYFLSPFENGIYQSVSQVSTLFSVVIAGVNLIVVPMFASAYHRRDYDSLQSVYTISTKWIFILSAPALIVLFISPGEVLSFLYSEPYNEGAGVLVILLLGQTLNLVTGSVNPLIVMTGNQNVLLRLSGTVLLINFILNIIVIPKFGIYGAATITAISIGGLFSFSVYWVKKKLDLWPYDYRYIKGIKACLVTIPIVIITSELVKNTSWSIIFQSIASFIVFFTALYFQKLEKEDIVFIKMFWQRIAGRRN